MICFMNDSQKFYATVELDGMKIATVKAQTHNDIAEIQERCWKKKKLADGTYDFDINFEKANIIRIRQAMTGDPKVGWEADRPVTEENISLLPKDIFSLILSKVNELDKSWDDGDAAKN